MASSSSGTRGGQSKTNEYSLSQFRQGKELGMGSFGVVQEVIDKETGEVFAMKVLDKQRVNDHGLQDQLNREVMVQLKAQHPNVVRMLYYFEDKVSVYCLLEYADRGQLFAYLKDHVVGLPEPRAAAFLTDVAQGLQYLHGIGVVHRDLKPENILLFGAALMAKIADLGWCAKLTAEEPNRQTFCGTMDYVAPEMLRGEPHDTAIDLWALGVLLYEMIMARAPFTGRSQQETVDNICAAAPKWPEGAVSEGCAGIIRGLLQRDKQARMPLAKLLQHPWIVTLAGAAGGADSGEMEATVVKKKPGAAAATSEEMEATVVKRKPGAAGAASEEMEATVVKKKPQATPKAAGTAVDLDDTVVKKKPPPATSAPAVAPAGRDVELDDTVIKRKPAAAQAPSTAVELDDTVVKRKPSQAPSTAVELDDTVVKRKPAQAPSTAVELDDTVVKRKPPKASGAPASAAESVADDLLNDTVVPKRSKAAASQPSAAAAAPTPTTAEDLLDDTVVPKRPQGVEKVLKKHGGAEAQATQPPADLLERGEDPLEEATVVVARPGARKPAPTAQGSSTPPGRSPSPRAGSQDSSKPTAYATATIAQLASQASRGEAPKLGVGSGSALGDRLSRMGEAAVSSGSPAARVPGVKSSSALSSGSPGIPPMPRQHMATTALEDSCYIDSAKRKELEKVTEANKQLAQEIDKMNVSARVAYAEIVDTVGSAASQARPGTSSSRFGSSADVNASGTPNRGAAVGSGNVGSGAVRGAAPLDVSQRVASPYERITKQLDSMNESFNERLQQQQERQKGRRLGCTGAIPLGAPGDDDLDLDANIDDTAELRRQAREEAEEMRRERQRAREAEHSERKGPQQQDKQSESRKPAEETRLSEDGEEYTYSQFLEFFGEDEGPVRWQIAGASNLKEKQEGSDDATVRDWERELGRRGKAANEQQKVSASSASGGASASSAGARANRDSFKSASSAGASASRAPDALGVSFRTGNKIRDNQEAADDLAALVSEYSEPKSKPKALEARRGALEASSSSSRGAGAARRSISSSRSRSPSRSSSSSSPPPRGRGAGASSSSPPPRGQGAGASSSSPPPRGRGARSSSSGSGSEEDVRERNGSAAGNSRSSKPGTAASRGRSEDNVRDTRVDLDEMDRVSMLAVPGRRPRGATPPPRGTTPSPRGCPTPPMPPEEAHQAVGSSSSLAGDARGGKTKKQSSSGRLCDIHELIRQGWIGKDCAIQVPRGWGLESANSPKAAPQPPAAQRRADRSQANKKLHETLLQEEKEEEEGVWGKVQGLWGSWLGTKEPPRAGR